MDDEHTPTNPDADLSPVLISLLKGVLYRDTAERLWGDLMALQARVRDYVAVLGLELVLDEAEGYSFLKSRPEASADAADTTGASDVAVPRLVARRPLSFPVSLLLALLRKKLAEFDASGGDTRLVVNRDELLELTRVFLPDGPNEARLMDQMDTTINKVLELGFLRKLKATSPAASGPDTYEVKRILKAFVDAQWLADFDARLAVYQTALSAVNKPKGPAV